MLNDKLSLQNAADSPRCLEFPDKFLKASQEIINILICHWLKKVWESLVGGGGLISS